MKNGLSVEQITPALQQAGDGVAVGEVCRQVGISERTYQATKEKLGERLELVRGRDDFAARIALDEARANELTRTVTQLSRFRVQYNRERSQLEFLSESTAGRGHREGRMVDVACVDARCVWREPRGCARAATDRLTMSS